MLGNLIKTLLEAADKIEQSEQGDASDLFVAIAAWLRNQPNGQTLRQVSRKQWKHRRASLWRLNNARTKAVHAVFVAGTSSPPGDGKTEEIGGKPSLDNGMIWSEIVQDQTDAFFRYFPAIFVPPPGPQG
jgi:hypothetical protein